jgi:hypothetical protein
MPEIGSSTHRCAGARAIVLGVLFAAGASSGAATRPQPADLIFINGGVYTQDARQPWVEAVAVRQGRIVAVGMNAGVQETAGPKTTVVDLKGRMLMSGLIDDHVHAMEGSLASLYDCLFPSSSTPEEIRRILQGCVRHTPSGAWIGGGRWDSSFFKNYSIPSPRRWLDDITGNRPLLWRDDTGHNAWVNSAALRRAGVDAKTPDPVGGQFEREPGSTMPDGLALEAAAERVDHAIPARPARQYREAVLHTQRMAHGFGIVGLKEADALTPEIAAYSRADRRHELHLYVATCISTLAMQDRPGRVVDFNAIDRIRDEYRTPLVQTDFVKFYLDGVPTSARTAAMLEPYLPDENGRRVKGDLHVDPDVLARDLIELDGRGYTVKMHAAGDRAIRVGLDAIAAARQAHPESDLRHELAHAGFIAPEDLPRFHALNAVAELSPVIWYPSPIIDAVIDAVGDRGRQYWPMRSLLESGARLAAGSDWPSVVESMDPWGGVQAMITRSDPYHASSATLWPEQAIGLADALRIYTLGGAEGIRRVSETGSIVVGKSADFVVLDRNLFEIPVTDIKSERVQETYFRGRRVYRRAAAPK